jgi:hypothetical protein
MSGVSTFTEAVGDRICDRTAEGESFRIICRHEDMPALSTLCSSGWLQRGVLGEMCPPARSSGALFDEILDIANMSMVGRTTKADKDGGFVEVTTGEMIDYWRLQVDAP